MLVKLEGLDALKKYVTNLVNLKHGKKQAWIGIDHEDWKPETARNAFFYIQHDWEIVPIRNRTTIAMGTISHIASVIVTISQDIK